MQRELAFLKTGMLRQEGLSAKPAGRPVQIRGGEVEIAETRQLQRRVNRLRGSLFGSRVVCQMGRCGRRRGGRLGRGYSLPLFELCDSFFQTIDTSQQLLDLFPGSRSR